MSGLLYIVLECVKLAVPFVFKYMPVDTRDMVLWVDTTKTVLLALILIIIGHGCAVTPNQVSIKQEMTPIVQIR